MTEAEWLACDDLHEMLEFLRRTRRLTDRKWRLLGVACCHRISALQTDPRSRRAVVVAEQFADAVATAVELRDAFEAAFDAGAVLAKEKESDPAGFVAAGRDPLRSAAWAASSAAHPHEAADGLAFEAAEAIGPGVERPAQLRLLRCLFGNPFRTALLEPDTLTVNAKELGEAIYADRAFDRLPILADALEDAGCTDAAILDHCRQPGEHARGCWVVDLVLGSS